MPLLLKTGNMASLKLRHIIPTLATTALAGGALGSLLSNKDNRESAIAGGIIGGTTLGLAALPAVRLLKNKSLSKSLINDMTNVKNKSKLYKKRSKALGKTYKKLTKKYSPYGIVGAPGEAKNLRAVAKATRAALKKAKREGDFEGVLKAKRKLKFIEAAGVDRGKILSYNTTIKVLNRETDRLSENYKRLKRQKKEVDTWLRS